MADVTLRFKTEDKHLIDLLVSAWLNKEDFGLFTKEGMDYVTLTYVKES